MAVTQEQHISELHSCVADELCGRKAPSKKAPKRRKKKSKINQTPDTYATGPSMSAREEGFVDRQFLLSVCACG